LATRELTMQTYEEARQAARAHKSFLALESKLLAIGGTRVEPSRDPPIDLLIQQGQVIAGEPAKKFRGRQCQCHRNVALRYLANPGAYQIATGYGLTADDGCWRRHSWLWDGERVMETTVMRDVYFGVVLDHVAAAGFVLGVVVYLLPELEEFLLRIDGERERRGDVDHPNQAAQGQTLSRKGGGARGVAGAGRSRNSTGTDGPGGKRESRRAHP
jgi:hypothetical protein